MQRLAYQQKNTQKEVKAKETNIDDFPVIKRRSSSLTTEFSPLRESNGLFGKENGIELEYDEENVSFFGLKKRNKKENKFSIFKDDEDDNEKARGEEEISTELFRRELPLKNKENQKTDNASTKQFGFARPQRPLLELSVKNHTDERAELPDLQEKKEPETNKKSLKKTLVSKLNTISAFTSEMIAEAQEYEQKVASLQNELNLLKKETSEKETQYSRLSELCKTAKNDLAAQREIMGGFISKTNEKTRTLQVTENELQNTRKKLKEEEEKISFLKAEMKEAKEKINKKTAEFTEETDALNKKKLILEQEVVEKSAELKRKEDFLGYVYQLQTEITKNNQNKAKELESEIKEEMFLIERKIKEKNIEAESLRSTIEETRQRLAETKEFLKEKEKSLLSYEQKCVALEKQKESECEGARKVASLWKDEKNKTAKKEETIQHLKNELKNIKNEVQALLIETEKKSKEIESLNKEATERSIQAEREKERLEKTIKEENDHFLQATKEVQTANALIQELSEKEKQTKKQAETQLEAYKKELKEITDKYQKEKETTRKEIQTLQEKLQTNRQTAENQLEEQKRKLLSIVQGEKTHAQQEKMDLEVQIEEHRKQIVLLEKKKRRIARKETKNKARNS